MKKLNLNIVIYTIFFVIFIIHQSFPLFAQEFEYSHHQINHKNIKCDKCHLDAENADQIRPGKLSHQICSDAACHQIYQKTEANLSNSFCLTCHTKDRPWNIQKSDIKAFPTKDDRNEKEFCTSFNHDIHLPDRTKDAQKECLKCHIIDLKEKVRENPKHQECVGCHAIKNSNQNVHSMENCEQCHQEKKKKQNQLCTKWSKSRLKISKFFKHDQHLVDIRKNQEEALSCGFCHSNIQRVDTKKNKFYDLLPEDVMGLKCKSCHNGKTINPKTKTALFSVNDGKFCKNCHTDPFSETETSKAHTGEVPSW